MPPLARAGRGARNRRNELPQGIEDVRETHTASLIVILTIKVERR